MKVFKTVLHRSLVLVVVLSLFAPQWLAVAQAVQVPPAAADNQANPPSAPPGAPPLRPPQPTAAPAPKATPKPVTMNSKTDPDAGDDPYGREDSFYSKRIAGDPKANFTIADAAAARLRAANETISVAQSQQNAPQVPDAFGGAWTALGPNPMTLISRATNGAGNNDFVAMSGRIGALAIRSTAPYTIYLGGAQGGVWVGLPPTNTLANTWTPKTDQLASLAIGALALAPSNEDIVYVGTGEGASSGDSYFGNGVLKSTDAGNSFAKISAAGYFTNVSISKIVVDPNNANHLYAATLRGRGGERRTSPPNQSPWGIYESTDGGVNWTPRNVVSFPITTTTAFNGGATDLVMDPIHPNEMYASFMAQGISKTVDSGLTWFTVHNGFPAGIDFNAATSRVALGISHPTAAVSATLYAGFEWVDNTGYNPSSVWKSTDEAGTWTHTNTAVVDGYCGTAASSQCTYDNVIGVDPISPTIVYALGLFDYGNGRGGVYRSQDGGATWKDLGYNQHPDFHAIAIRKDSPGNIVIGNDGGVWYSSSYGGRLGATDPISAVTWIDLNGTVDPNSIGVTVKSSGLQIAQFESIVGSPSNANRFYGGTQDNGTLRKASGSGSWFDFGNGDGGKALISIHNPLLVYGERFGISPYRFDDGFGLTDSPDPRTNAHGFFLIQGINLADRSEFYAPWVIDPASENRMYYGTFRVYRTDNGDSPNPPATTWSAISGDLTSGCSGAAPNGGRNCTITAFGISAGAPALYVGTQEGYVWLSTDATIAAPTFNRVDKAPLPGRPVNAIAVDRSNFRTAYVAFSGFDGSTPSAPGHIFKTTNAGATWTNVTNNLPDMPVNEMEIDRSDPNILYAGTDAGVWVSNNGGTSWTVLGTGLPIVSINGMDLNPFTRQLAVATHGRGGWKLADSGTLLPALEVRKELGPDPIGPGRNMTYTIAVRNYGNTPATGVIITDPVPANTTFSSATGGGVLVGGKVTWLVPVVAKPTVNANTGLDEGVITVTFSVAVTTANTITSGSTITNDGLVVTSLEGPGAVGSPVVGTVAPTLLFALTPLAQTDGSNPGQTVTYTQSIQNLGLNNDTYNLSVTGNSYTTTFWNAANTVQITQLAVTAFATGKFVVRVNIPPGAADAASDTATIHATSQANSASQAATLTTLVTTRQVLIVDNSTGIPNVQARYQNIVASTGLHSDLWDLNNNGILPLTYAKAHKAVVWFTGQTYPIPFAGYETKLADYLDNGGRLFMSSLDGLDQSGGTTPFVLNYLHINWDGTENQNDKSTDPMTVTASITNTSFAPAGTFFVDHASIGYGAFSDWITPVSPAQVATRDAGPNQTNGLSVTANSPNTGKEYRVVFFAWPLEAVTTAQDRNKVMAAVMDYFGLHVIYMPIIEH